MTDHLKFLSLVLFMLAAAPIIWLVQVLVAVILATLEVAVDVIESWQSPKDTYWYRWMGWE